jgi:hypothetical protein
MSRGFTASRDVTGVEVEIYGLRSLERLMKGIAPDLLKEMDAKIREQLEPVQASARGFVPNTPPMSGWKAGNAAASAEKAVHRGPRRKSRGGAGWPGWDSSEISKGIVIRKGQAKARKANIGSVAWRLENKSAAGAIYEIAGRKSSGNSPAGKQFIKNLERHGAASRLIWKAWDQHKGTVIPAIVDTVDAYEAELQKRIDSIDEAA